MIRMVVATAGVLFGGWCHAQSFDRVGRAEMLSAEPGRGWVFVGTSLVDVIDDRFLGQLGVAGNSGPVGYPLAFSGDRRSLFTIESFYSRGNRGERTDTVTFFDNATLGVAGEVIIPPKTALMLARDGAIALSDDNRYLAVFNLTPATSLSIVDVENRRFVEEISTPGCSLAYGAGVRRFVMLCIDGAILTVSLDQDGTERSKVRTEGFFDPQADPVTEAAARAGDHWLFSSFDGIVHSIDVSRDEPAFGERWSLLTDTDRAENWRIAGVQHLAVHEESNRLYSLVRQSETPLDDPKALDGHEVWVYDLATRQRVARWPALADGAEIENAGRSGIGATSGDGASRIVVTRGDDAMLVTAGAVISVRSAATGEFLHDRLGNAPESGRLTVY